MIISFETDAVSNIFMEYVSHIVQSYGVTNYIPNERNYN